MIAALLVFLSAMIGCAGNKEQKASLDITAYLDAADGKHIYPSLTQLEMLKSVLPKESFRPAPPASDRNYWDKIAGSEAGALYLEEALSLLDRAPEVPISDEIYRRANKEGNRGIYKPRYYNTMDRLEKFILAECIENKDRFLPQIETYTRAIMAMKSWMHPNHDDRENSVLEGKRVAIDLGARKFGLVLALSDALLEDKLPAELRTEMAAQLQWRMMDSYLKSCKGEDTIGNTWIRSTSNWNSVCTSGTIFTTIVASENSDERIAAVGCALNSMVYYLSGFGKDGYCSEGTGYWSYGFGHYLYLAEILLDYSDGKINLFEFNEPLKLKRVADFPRNFQIAEGLYSPFSDGVTRVKGSSNNFAYFMAAKYYGTQKPSRFIPDESVETLIAWSYPDAFAPSEAVKTVLPAYTYFDDFGIVISRGQQQVPFSISIKAGHNAENHNHSDVGSYIVALGDDIMTGDIGAPSYIAGAFSKDNPARSSWGHPVPRIDNSLQSNGLSFRGEVLETEFTKEADKVVLDLLPAYEVASLEKLNRIMINDKSDEGTITVKDVFKANKALAFGTAIMVNVAFEILDDKTVLISSENQKVKAEITATGGTFKIKDELVPVTHLREGGPAYRIGIDFDKPTAEGTITVKYTPFADK